MGLDSLLTTQLFKTGKSAEELRDMFHLTANDNLTATLEEEVCFETYQYSTFNVPGVRCGLSCCFVKA